MTAPTVIGPCVGCDNWTLEMTLEDAQPFLELKLMEDLYPDVSADKYYTALMDAIEEHMDSCEPFLALEAADKEEDNGSR